MLPIIFDRLRRTHALSRVPVDGIRHFSGFRYGVSQLNPYQTFAQMLQRGVPLAECTSDFAVFLQSFRPTCFGSLFGDNRLLQKPLWVYPWQDRSGKPREKLGDSGWVPRAVDVPDVMTHFSTEGIPQSLLHEEAGWHQAALGSIDRFGYQPKRFSPIRVVEVRRQSAMFWIATDGNHRLSALCARGVRSVDVSVDDVFAINKPQKLPGVLSGLYTPDEVDLLFFHYLIGVNTVSDSATRAEIV